MEAALGLAEDISVETIFAMHKALMRHQACFEQGLAGRFRKEQVWIGPGNADLGGGFCGTPSRSCR